MRTDGVVKSLNIGENVSLGVSSGRIMVEMDAFTFEAAEEIFGNSVVERVTFAGHALTDSEVSQTLAVR